MLAGTMKRIPAPPGREKKSLQNSRTARSGKGREGEARDEAAVCGQGSRMRVVYSR